MKTTLKRIKENRNRPCQRGWKLLISNVDNDLDRELPIKEILKSNGIKDAVWALQCVDDQKSVRLFAADIAESVLHIFEERDPNDQRPRLAIQTARDFANGLIDNIELDNARDAAYDAALDAYNTNCTDCTVNDAAYAAGACAAWYAARDVASTTAYAAIDAVGFAAKQDKWQEIEKLLLKYL